MKQKQLLKQKSPVSSTKSPKRNMKLEKDNKQVPWDDDYYCVFSFKNKPINENAILSFAVKLREWVDNPENDPFKISEFYLGLGIHRQTWDRWVAKYQPLREANAYALERLGNLKEKEATLNDGIYDAGMVKATLAHYCPVYKQEQERLAALNKKEDSKALAEDVKNAVNEVMRNFNAS